MKRLSISPMQERGRRGAAARSHRLPSNKLEEEGGGVKRADYKQGRWKLLRF